MKQTSDIVNNFIKPLENHEVIKIIDKILFDNNVHNHILFDTKEINILLRDKIDILKTLEILKNDPQLSFKMLIDVCGVDYLYGRNNVGLYKVLNKYSSNGIAEDINTNQSLIEFHKNTRFEVVYHLLSFKLNSRVRIKVFVNDEETVESVSDIFNSACWFEREVFDMFGIYFTNSPDCRRILTDYNFKGFPLRKDFPLTGYKQIRYDNDKKEIIQEDVSLTQEYRKFEFETPWTSAVYDIKNTKN